MTSRHPPDDTDQSGQVTTADSGNRSPEEGDVEGSTLRSRLSNLRVALIALAVLLSLFAAAATAPAAAVLPGEDPTPAPGNDITSAVTTDGATETDGTTREEVSGSFGRPLHTGVAGDPVDIRHAVGASGGDSAYLLVGGNRLTDTGGTIGFVDVIRVSGSSTTINTRLIGTNESSVDSCSNPDIDCDLEFRDEDGTVIAESLAELPRSTGAGGLAHPLVPQRYRLAITNGTFVVQDSGSVDPVKMADESDLVLRKPSFHDEVEVFTTADPDDIADGGDGSESFDALEQNGLDRTAVTKGDRVVLGFESTGMWGALSYFAEQRSGESLEAGQEIDHRVLADLLEAEEGVSLRVQQTNRGRNERRAELDLADADPEDVTLLLANANELETAGNDQTPGRFYLVLDTSDDGPFTVDPEPGDEFSVEFALEGTEGEQYAFADSREPPAAFEPASAADDRVSEQFPYHETGDGRVSAEASFSVQERFLRYDNVTDDGRLLVEADEGTITGTTSLLPVTEMSATIVRDDNETPSRTESELTISGGNFSIDSGLTDTAPGTQANYRLYEGQSLRDSRTMLVVGDAEDPARLRLTDATTTNHTVTRGESLSGLSATVRNVGELETREQLSLDVADGSIVEQRHITVGPDAPQNETFAEPEVDLEPGEYPYTFAIDGDEVNGTLTVETDPAVTRVGEGDGDAGDPESTDGPGDTDGDEGENASSNDEDGSGDDSGSEGGNSTGTDDGENENDEPTDQGPATLLPFGIGTRETFGGTVLVGVTYILGHWV